MVLMQCLADPLFMNDGPRCAPEADDANSVKETETETTTSKPVAFKDRPPVLELLVRTGEGGEKYSNYMTVTAPVVNGEMLWRVAYNNSDVEHKLSYRTPESVASLIDGATLAHPNRGMQLEVRCDNWHGKKAVVARWKMEPSSMKDSHLEKIIKKALKVLETK